jgi:glycosyltransferase involved in cell wall biosynthesis
MGARTATGERDGTRPWIVVGPVPPVLHGVAFMTPHVLEGMRRADMLAAHLDTSDERPAYTTNTLDLLNVWLAIRHLLGLVVLLARHRDAQLYVPISQGRWGFLRDATLIGAARLARRPVTVHLHGGLFAKFYAEAAGWERRLIRLVLGQVERAWVLTEAHREIFDGLIPRERVSVLQNTSEDVGGAAPGDGDEGELRLLFLSNLFPEKGCIDLIDALEALGERGRGISLRLIGEAEPAIAAEVGERAAALAEAGVSVEYAGTRTGEAKMAEYRWADAFALPSRYPPEGQPLVLLEAMSAGLPIVASDHSGIPWTVRDGVEGLIVPSGDVAALAEAIARLREDAALRAELGANARRRYEDAYTNEAFYEALGRLAVAE